MAVTYDKIATTTLGSDQTTVTFSSISGSYTDLILVMNGKVDIATTTKTNVGNGSIDTSANYSFIAMSGTGSSAAVLKETNQNQFYNEWYANWDTTYRSITIIQFMNYSNTNTFKTLLFRSGNPATGVDAQVGLWRSTSAINIITIGCRNAGHKLSAGSTFTIYGILKA
jgi:hypothetical protein